MSFADIANLQLPVLSVFAQLMSTVMDALRQSKAAVHLQSDDVQLSPHSAIFALMDSAVPVTACDLEKPLLYPAATSQLPDSIRELFRVVSMMTLDFQLSVEVMLFSQGQCVKECVKMSLLWQFCVLVLFCFYFCMCFVGFCWGMSSVPLSLCNLDVSDFIMAVDLSDFVVKSVVYFD